MQQSKSKYYVISIVFISFVLAVLYSFDMKEVWQQKGIYFPTLLLICGGILYNSIFLVKAIKVFELNEKYQNKVLGFAKFVLTVGVLFITSLILTLNPELPSNNVAEGFANVLIVINFVIIFYIIAPLIFILVIIITKLMNTCLLNKPSDNKEEV